MVDVRPFRALRPAPGSESRVVSPPYDVVDVEEPMSSLTAVNESEAPVVCSRSSATIDPFAPSRNGSEGSAA